MKYKMEGNFYENALKKIAMLMAVITVVSMPAGNVMAASKTFTHYQFTTKVGWYQNTSGVQKRKYPSKPKVKKGTTCRLYVTGNANVKKKYTEVLWVLFFL